MNHHTYITSVVLGEQGNMYEYELSWGGGGGTVGFDVGYKDVLHNNFPIFIQIQCNLMLKVYFTVFDAPFGKSGDLERICPSST
jgi:hypothetical protein